MPPNGSGSAAGRSRPASRRDTARRHAARPMRPKATVDPYAGFEARIVPENITLLPKSAEQDRRAERLERAHRRRQEERVRARSILRDLGASPDDIRGADGGARAARTRRRPARRPEAAHPVRARRRAPARRARDRGRRQRVEAVVALSDTGKYVAVDVQSMARQHRGRRSRRGRRERHQRRCGSIRASTRPRCAIRCRAR